ncbi:hypothetical protein [Clavibacter michiganensis]|uniref:hypothetical protein n=1 Tax=Clavibacter michiganensis TaxID=28447 RepID=UPI001FF0D454|nr:hypothetical protein [Clavibacter michiganensis]
MRRVVGITIKRTSIPGSSLIQKVLQQASSKTLPDVLMLDNPDLQQIAATGALARSRTSASPPTATRRASSTRAPTRQDVRPRADREHDRLFYDKAMLADAGIQPPRRGTS